VKLVIGLLGAAAVCARVIVGVNAYRDDMGGARPLAQLHATATPSARPPATPSATAAPAPAPTTAPARASAPTVAPTGEQATASGTYWVCEPDVNASGVVQHSLDAAIEAEGGVISPACERALQIDGILKAGSGGYAYRVAAGHFTAFFFCGVTVANIVDVVPSDINVPPSQWIAADYELYSANWAQGAPSGTC
jgi:hypothetical protein